MSDRLHNKKQLFDRRKELRNNLTPAEAALWSVLKNGQLGRKFRRQHSIGPYVADFYCAEEQLVIELNGQHHFTTPGFESDVQRTQYLEEKGFRVIRFENKLVFDHLETVIAEIRSHFKNN